MADYLVYESGCTSSSTTRANTWDAWNQVYHWAASGSNETVWTAWNIATSNSASATTAIWAPAPAETEEQRTQREVHARERRKRQREVEAKAEALLRSFLTPDQEQMWDRENRFEVMVQGGDKPARHYRIAKGTHGNIQRLEAGKVVETLCVQPSKVPVQDANLAQLLHLIHDEEGLRKKAGIQRVA